MSSIKICVEKDGKQSLVSPLELEELTGAAFILSLEIEPSVQQAVHRLGEKMLRKHRFATTQVGFYLGQFASAVTLVKRELRMQQIWRGQYYQKEISFPSLSGVFLKWIDARVGWGLFAARSFRAREFVAEYTGVVRKRARSDRYNGYCFEYVSEPGRSTPFLIDAKERSGIARYMNHSEQPNTEPVLATIGSMTHLILLTKRAIKQGEQLCYDYGPTYWKKRSAPNAL